MYVFIFIYSIILSLSLQEDLICKMIRDWMILLNKREDPDPGGSKSYASFGSESGSVVHPDPNGPKIICKLGSGSVINSGFESGSKLFPVSN